MTDFMKRIAKSQANPNSLPEYDAWMMIKNGHRFTLRWRLIPLGDQKFPDPRFYSNDRFLKSYVIRDGKIAITNWYRKNRPAI